MALFKSGQLLMKRIYKTESIFNEILKRNIPISKVVNNYLKQITKVHSNLTDLLQFPFQTFHKVDKKILKSIISETYNIIKTKSSVNSMVYNNLLRSYMYYKIDFDIDDVVKDMEKYQVDFDQKIYSNFIKYYSHNGEMIAVENLLNEMKKKNIDLSMTNKFIIASGYIISGQPEQAENFIKENKLNMESHDMFYSRCFGYASIGDVASLKKVLAEMKEKNIVFSSKEFCILYYKLIYGGVDESNLNEIIDLTKTHLVNSSTQLYILTIILNSADHFQFSKIIIEKLVDLIEGPIGFIELFVTSRCPINTVNEVLTILVPRCGNMFYERNIFCNLAFDSAFDICQKFSKIDNWKVIHCCLLNKAISEKSLTLIGKALHFSLMNLQWWQINLLILHVFLPSMQAKGIVSNYEEILYLFPEFKNQILPVILIKHLCSGNYIRYNELLSKQKIMKNLIVSLDWKYFAIEMRNNLTLQEINKWLVEAEKCFDTRLINIVLTHLFINEMMKLSKNESSNEIKELIDYAKEWKVELTQSNIDYLIKAVPKHSDLIRYSMGKDASYS